MAALLTALAAAPSAGARTAAVDAALKRADAPVSQLEVSSTPVLPGGTVVSRFGQEVGGVPVVGAGAVVLDDAGAAPQLLFDETSDRIAPPGAAAVSRAAALDSAGAGAGAKHASARQVIVPGGDGTLAWEVTYSSMSPLGDWVVEVDAHSGEVLSRLNLTLDATGQAQVFVPNAVVENDGYSGISDSNDSDSTTLTNLRTPVTLDNLDNAQFCLEGAYANVTQGAQRDDVCDAPALDWSDVTRANKQFEALMAYEHVDAAQTYIQGLDFSGTDGVNEESQEVVANAISDDNSFYQPFADRITLGRGGVDDGEDADVIVHEYGHAVQDAQNPDAFRAASNQTGAQGEGFGDYLAEAYSTEVAGFDDEWSHCVMEWDATSYDNNSNPPRGICLRRTDVTRTRSEQQNRCKRSGQGRNEIHCIGEVWASALFELRQQLGDAGGKSIMDKVVLASHFLLPPAPTFKEASKGLIAADEAEYGGGDHCHEIRAEMVSRELLGAGFTC